MKLVSLNIWGGQILDPLLDFFTKNGKDIDIFCLQEVLNETKSYPKGNSIGNADNPSHGIYSKLQNILTNHKGYFSQRQDDEGLAIFVRKDLEISTVSDIFILGSRNSWINKNPETKGCNLQYAFLRTNDKNFIISHTHGYYSKKGKIDTPERIKQSENINSFLEKQKGAKILCGDFNLEYNTQSVSILEKNMENLIKKFKISSTRTPFYEKFEKDKFADYMFTSKDVKILDFKVLPDVVSDHSALYLEFE